MAGLFLATLLLGSIERDALLVNKHAKKHDGFDQTRGRVRGTLGVSAMTAVAKGATAPH
jgi:hypothetical protein